MSNLSMITPAVASWEDNNYIIVWHQSGENGTDIFAQVYAPNGDAISDVQMVNSDTLGTQKQAEVEVLKDGSVVIGWNSGSALVTQRFDLVQNGPTYELSAQDPATTIDSDIGVYHKAPDIEALEDGGYAVAWHDRGWSNFATHVKIYNADGSVRVNDVNFGGSGAPRDIDIEQLTNGNILAVWDEWSSFGNVEREAFRSIIDTDGNIVASKSRLNDRRSNQDTHTQATALDNGGYAVTWDHWEDRSLIFTVRDQSGARINYYHQRHGTYSLDNHAKPEVTQLKNGDLVLAYHKDHNGDGKSDILAKHTDINGNGTESLYVLATDSSRNLSDVDLHVREDGKLLAVYTGLQATNDVVFSNFNIVTGTDSSDTLYGSEGSDYIEGLGGNDSLFAQAGDDYLLGGDGNDWLDAGEGSDTVLGGAGDDTLDAGYHSGDEFDGGEGVDTVLFWRHRGGDLDVDLAAGTATSSGGDQFTLTSVENAYGSDLGNDTILGTDGENFLRGVGGDDLLDGRGGNDTLEGDAGNDHLIGGDGYDKLYGGNDQDTLDGGLSNDTLDGGSGDDQLNGGDRHDWLFGGDGNDTLNGGTGNDLLKGEAGADVFKFDADFGVDNVMDFNTSEDSIELSSLNVSYADLTITQEGDNTLIEVVGHEGNSILLTGVTATDLTESMFTFI